MNKREAIKDVKLKRKLFPNIGRLFLLKCPKRGYFTVSEKYYNENDFMKEYKVKRII